MNILFIWLSIVASAENCNSLLERALSFVELERQSGTLDTNDFDLILSNNERGLRRTLIGKALTSTGVGFEGYFKKSRTIEAKDKKNILPLLPYSKLNFVNPGWDLAIEIAATPITEYQYTIIAGEPPVQTTSPHSLELNISNLGKVNIVPERHITHVDCYTAIRFVRILNMLASSPKGAPILETLLGPDASKYIYRLPTFHEAVALRKLAKFHSDLNEHYSSLTKNDILYPVRLGGEIVTGLQSPWLEWTSSQTDAYGGSGNIMEIPWDQDSLTHSTNGLNSWGVQVWQKYSSEGPDPGIRTVKFDYSNDASGFRIVRYKRI